MSGNWHFHGYGNWIMGWNGLKPFKVGMPGKGSVTLYEQWRQIIF